MNDNTAAARSLHRRLRLLLIALAAAPAHAATCEEIAANIGDRIRANGVAEFMVAAVDAAASAPGRQVGTCDAGRKKIMYVRGATGAFAAPVSATSPRTSSARVITECADGRVIEDGACEKRSRPIHHAQTPAAGERRMQRQLQFFYFIGSTYSYLSVARAEPLASQAGVELIWRPFSVRTLMREQNNIPFATKPQKMKYMWRDLERRAQRFGVPFEGALPIRSIHRSWPTMSPRWRRAKAGARRSPRRRIGPGSCTNKTLARPTTCPASWRPSATTRRRASRERPTSERSRRTSSPPIGPASSDCSAHRPSSSEPRSSGAMIGSRTRWPGVGA